MVRIIYAHTDSRSGQQHWVSISLCVSSDRVLQSAFYRAGRCQDRSYSSAHSMPSRTGNRKYAYSDGAGLRLNSSIQRCPVATVFKRYHASRFM